MNIVFSIRESAGYLCQRSADAYAERKLYIFADSDNAPYGTKTKEEVKSLLSMRFNFSTKKIKALVIACNTATSAAVRDLRKHTTFR